ncbi:MAG: hypothetical protein ACXU86_10035 [Archangium sp.]
MAKTSKSSCEEAEQCGPYQLHEQVEQDGLGKGELYRATHETSGVTALVLKPATVEGAEPLREWRVRCVSSASPSYMALEAEDSRWAVAPDKHSVEALMCLFEEVHKGVRRVADALPASDEPRPWRRPGLVLAGAAAVCALVFARVHGAPMSRPQSGPDPLARAAPAPMSHEVPIAQDPDTFSNGALYDTTPLGQPVLAKPLPSEPFKGQKRPPCTRYTEVELVGACWVPHELKAPCPDALFEYQGKCYLPIFSVKPPPQSLEQ